MKLEDDTQLENTRMRMDELEALYSTTQTDPKLSDSVRQVTMNSLRKTINGMKEEVTRYVSRQSAGSNQAT